ncbi:LysR family transcriptional regulator [Marinobacter sp. C2H3]|uniref:LysR family transcriptional regulator n=1 Tax=Marinobacter sp. C2H3 TaxID=3119003 RepID=UPI00300EFEB7
MDRLREMQTFCAVVDAGSFAAAADALGLSRAAVSRDVNDLESRLGVRLLHRTTRRLSLTAEGEVFQERCRELLAGVAEAEAEVTARRGVARGKLRLNVPVSFGISHLAPLWGRFHQQYPEVDLTVELLDRLADIVDEGFDLAIRIARLQSSTLISRQLTTTRLKACASPEYLSRHGQPRTPSELASHRTIAYSHFASGNDWPFDGPAGPETVKVRPWMHANNGETCCAAALAGEGIILQPGFLVNGAIERGHLVPLLTDYESRRLGVYAVYPSRRFVTPKVRAMVDFLLAALPEEV